MVPRPLWWPLAALRLTMGEYTPMAIAVKLQEFGTALIRKRPIVPEIADAVVFVDPLLPRAGCEARCHCCLAPYCHGSFLPVLGSLRSFAICAVLLLSSRPAHHLLVGCP